MDYVVVSTAVTDDLTLADGTHIGYRLGGAGIYAMSGIRLWTDQVALVTGVGEDFAQLYASWFAENGCTMLGLTVKDAHTAVSNVQYHADGERTETPQYGGAHYRMLEAAPDDIAPFTETAKGVYIFKDLNDAYWDRILQLKRRHGFKLLWEINADAAVPEQRERVQKLARQCDVFSINRTEACKLFSENQLDWVIAKLQTWGVPMIYLRMGGSGAAVLHDSICERIPCMPNVSVVDATGAGNSSSAAVLYGYCEGMPPKVCGILGSVAAAHIIEQYGPPSFSPTETARALAEVKQMSI